MRVLRTRMEADLWLPHILDCEASLNLYKTLRKTSLTVPRQPDWLLRLLLPVSHFEIHRNVVPHCH